MNQSILKKLFPVPLRQSALSWLPLAVLLLILDQLTKYYATQHLYLGVSMPVLPSFNFTLVYNYGAAFGFLNQGDGWQQIFFIVVALFASMGFTLWLTHTPKQQRLEGLGIALLLSGAIGNLIDRLQYGYVIDFIDWYAGDYHWPAFNLADSFICVGVALIILQMLLHKKIK